MEEEIKKFIDIHLAPSHESSYKRGSMSWTDSKWIAVISYKIDIPRGEHRKFSAIVRKHVSTVKSQLG